MVIKLLDDMNKALDANCYFAALSIALMMPDICGKAEYSDDKVGDRYKKWFDEWIGQYEICPREDENEPIMPHLSGEVVYQLRNSFLHQGNPNIDKNKIKAEENKIDEFKLIVEAKNQFDLYASSSSLEHEGGYRTFSVNIRNLCWKIDRLARKYYERNKEKFNFFNFSIVDWDEVTKRFKAKGE